MGAAMLQCVIDAGYEVTIFDVVPEAAERFVEANGDRVDVALTPRDIGATCSVIDIVVNSDEQVLDVCLGPDGVLAGTTSDTIVLIHSTIAQDTLRRVAEQAAASGARVLDAAISGAQGHRSVGDLCVMVGGDESAFAEAKPVLDSYGGLVVHLGALGAGLDTELALNLLRYLTYIVSQETGRLANAAGVGQHMFEIVAHTRACAYVGDFSRGPFPEDLSRLQNNVETARKDLRAAIARGDELGIDLPAATLGLERIGSIWSLDEDLQPLPEHRER